MATRDIPPLRYLSSDRRARRDAAARGAPRARRADDDGARRRRRAAAEDRRPSAAGGLVRPRDAGPPARRRRRPAADDLLGIKWVTGFAGNRSRGLAGDQRPRSILSDPATGLPVAILDGGPITAQRTAAVSGVADPPVRAARWPAPTRVALIGAGVQGRSHLPVLGHRAAGRSSSRSTTATRIARRRSPRSRATTAGHRAAVVGAARHATRRPSADVVVTAASFTAPSSGSAMTGDWLTPDALVVAVDYATLRRRGGRPRRGAVPRRRPRAVPGEPRRRPVRRLSGPDGDARRGDPRRPRRARRPAASS